MWRERGVSKADEGLLVIIQFHPGSPSIISLSLLELGGGCSYGDDRVDLRDGDASLLVFDLLGRETERLRR